MKILQITAAVPGWYAHCLLPDGTSSNHRIAIWAIIEHDDARPIAVEGLTHEGRYEQLLTVEQAIIDDEEKFIGYAYNPNSE